MCVGWTRHISEALPSRRPEVWHALDMGSEHTCMDRPRWKGEPGMKSAVFPSLVCIKHI